MNVLVLGGYGFIGSAICRALLAHGHQVTGLGRRPESGRAILPAARWVGADLARLRHAADWQPLLEGQDVVVNAAGVLQSGQGDNVQAVQSRAMIALYEACERRGPDRLIQISAPGASKTADTAFMRTKGEADAALTASHLRWTILRPGLVLGEEAYGGTALLRLLAAVPLVQPIALARAPVQTVGRDEVSAVTVEAVEGRYENISFDLVEPEAHSLEALLLALRTWLGFKPPQAVLRLPLVLARPLAMTGDLAGWFGWRPALRTTAFQVLQAGVTGNANAFQQESGRSIRSLDETLDRLKASPAQRLEARLMLLMPVLLVLYAVFWGASGAIGLARIDTAAHVITGAVPEAFARPAVIAGSLADLAIGTGLLFRRTVRLACLGAILLSLGYLAAASLVVPGLWLDPLGPLMKVLPVIGLGCILHVLTGGHRRAH